MIERWPRAGGLGFIRGGAESPYCTLILIILGIIIIILLCKINKFVSARELQAYIVIIKTTRLYDQKDLIN